MCYISHITQHTTLTTQIQFCKIFKRLETNANWLCSNVSYFVHCTSNTHKRIAPTLNRKTMLDTNHLRFKCSSVRYFSDVKPSTMHCAPMSPILLSAHPNTNTHILSIHTSHHMTRYHITHHSPLKFSVVNDVSDLRPSPMDCAPTSPILLPVKPHTQSHTSQSTQTHITSHHTSLTAQIQCCQRCEWIETMTNGLCSNVSNFVPCLLNIYLQSQVQWYLACITYHSK